MRRLRSLMLMGGNVIWLFTILGCPGDGGGGGVVAGDIGGDSAVVDAALEDSTSQTEDTGEQDVLEDADEPDRDAPQDTENVDTNNDTGEAIDTGDADDATEVDGGPDPFTVSTAHHIEEELSELSVQFTPDGEGVLVGTTSQVLYFIDLDASSTELLSELSPHFILTNNGHQVYYLDDPSPSDSSTADLRLRRYSTQGGGERLVEAGVWGRTLLPAGDDGALFIQDDGDFGPGVLTLYDPTEDPAIIDTETHNASVSEDGSLVLYTARGEPAEGRFELHWAPVGNPTETTLVSSQALIQSVGGLGCHAHLPGRGPTSASLLYVEHDRDSWRVRRTNLDREGASSTVLSDILPSGLLSASGTPSTPCLQVTGDQQHALIWRDFHGEADFRRDWHGERIWVDLTDGASTSLGTTVTDSPVATFDDRHVLFRGYPSDLRLFRSGTSEPVLLSGGLPPFRQIEWRPAPNQDYAAFTTAGVSEYSVHLVNTLSGGTSTLFTSPEPNVEPGPSVTSLLWSPDSSYLALPTLPADPASPTSELHLAGVSEGLGDPLTMVAGVTPMWITDDGASKLLYLTHHNGLERTSDLVLHNPESETSQVLVPESAFADVLGTSPNQRYLLTTLNDFGAGTRNLELIDVQTGQRARLLSAPEEDGFWASLSWHWNAQSVRLIVIGGGEELNGLWSFSL